MGSLPKLTTPTVSSTLLYFLIFFKTQTSPASEFLSIFYSTKLHLFLVYFIFFLPEQNFFTIIIFLTTLNHFFTTPHHFVHTRPNHNNPFSKYHSTTTPQHHNTTTSHPNHHITSPPPHTHTTPSPHHHLTPTDICGGGERQDNFPLQCIQWLFLPQSFQPTAQNRHLHPHPSISLSQW